MAANTTASTSKPLDDAQIAAITDDANGAEIDQGKLAQTKAKDARVRAFAKMMVENHTQARRDQEKLHVSKADSPDSERAVRDAATALESLRRKSGSDFDKAYLQLPVDEHRKVLDTLDKELLPAAHDKQLKNYLEKIKPNVEGHLTRAAALEHDLDSDNSGSSKSAASMSHAKGTSSSSSTSSVSSSPPSSKR